MDPGRNPAAWAGALLDDWRRHADSALQQAQRRAQRLQRNVSEQTEALLQALQQHHANHTRRQPNAAPALGSISLAVGRANKGSFPGSGARFRRGLNVVADLADVGGGKSMTLAEAAPEVSSDAQPEPERILISEACPCSACYFEKQQLVCSGLRLCPCACLACC